MKSIDWEVLSLWFIVTLGLVLFWTRVIETLFALRTTLAGSIFHLLP